VVAVPEITPVVESSERPPGRGVDDHVYGPVPPLTVGAVEENVAPVSVV